jgi:ATP-dependent 26S proteasome regulatory subunit
MAAVSEVSAELLRAYLARFLVIHAEQRRLSATSAFGPSSEEVAVALAGAGEPHPAQLALHETRVAAARAAVDAVLASEPEPRLARLTRVLGLEPLDVVIVALLFAPELDHELERAVTFALDDFTRKRPDPGFLARMIGGVDDALVDRALVRFDEAAPLRRHGAIVLAQTADTPATMRVVRLSDRIVAFLRGHDTLDESVRGVARIERVMLTLDDIIMPAAVIEQIGRAIDSNPARVLLVGPDGCGRGLVAAACAARRRLGTLRIDLPPIMADARIGERVAAAIREAALRDACAIIDGGTLTLDDVPRALPYAIAEAANGVAVPIVFTFASHPTWLANAVPELVELEVPGPTFRERLALWRRELPPPLAADDDLDLVASRYAFTGGTIARAARRAFAAARLRAPDSPHVTLDDLGDAARLTFTHRLGGLAQRIPTGFAWSDLVLPKETLESVREVVRFAHHRPFLLEEWGFAAKLPYGRGISAILAGPPGTGKTMVAQLLAKELGYDLYRIDLSQIVNKYIGETEKNLARLFDEAESSHAVLFFDEADALFAKRTNVQSSNDRYANLEVNYLLQRMESYDGVTLLATNLEQGLDEAFKRRVRFAIQFELPDELERGRLWRSMFPPQVPLAADIDWGTLAKRFEMAGGYIKKAALRAALICVEARRPLTTADLLEAARLEYREMGRIV